jgi:hypothetical protein
LKLRGKTFRDFALIAAALWLALTASAAAKKVRHQVLPAAKRRKHYSRPQTLASRRAKSRTRAAFAKQVRSKTAHHAHTRSRHPYRSRRSSKYKVRLASIHMQPGRAEQIQQALAAAGYLHETPTGRWDSRTREAMKQYQQQNGFATTGLPDAKSLMKLGLGPHPLPPDADPIAQAKVFPSNAPGANSQGPGASQDQPEN